MNDVTSAATQAERLICALGRGLVETWSELPRNLQQLIFEQTVLAGHRSERDESLREQLAAFLHARHPRTAGTEGPRRRSAEGQKRRNPRSFARFAH
jgi:hypothetical protein